MQREDVIQLAKEAGMTGLSLIDIGYLELIATAVEQRTLYATLERAAQVCDQKAVEWAEQDESPAYGFAAAIRALKETK